MTLTAPRLLRSLLLYGLIAIFGIWCVRSFRLDLAQIDLHVIPQHAGVIAAALGLSLFNYVLRSVRWRLYLQQYGGRMSLTFAALTFIAGFAFTLSPGKAGEVMRARYYKDKNRGPDIGFGQVAAACFAERLMDLLAMVALAGGIALNATHSGGRVGWAACVAGAVAVVVGVACLRMGPWSRLASWVASTRLPAKIKASVSALAGVLNSAQRLFHYRLLIPCLVLGLLAWGAEGVGLKLIGGLAPSGDLSYATAIGIYAIAVVAGALSFLPGGLGTTEATMSALLVAYGVNAGDAILMTLVCRIITLWFAIALGWLAVLLLQSPLVKRAV